MPPLPASRAASLRRRLLAWWDRGHRDLPWRAPQGEADPYRAWIAEVMLQQTRVEAVVPYWRRFVSRWPTLEALAAADDADVLAAWSGLGYYARCRNLLAAARTALARHGGLPAELEALRALPGFGPYTAGAVASIAFGIPAAAVDGNVERVLSRLFRVGGDRRSPRVKKAIGSLAGSLVPSRRPGDWNQALMDLGATVCTPRLPRCATCPVSRDCEALAAGRVGEYPGRIRRKAPRTVQVALARVERRDSLLLARAPEGGLLGGLWGLPAFEMEPGEEAPDALRRGFGAAGLAVVVGEEAGALVRVLTHRRLAMRVHACRLSGRKMPRSGGMRFTTEAETSRLPASTAMRRAIEVSGGWPRRTVPPEGTKNVSGESRKPLTYSGPPV